MELFFLPCTRTIHGRNVDCAAAKHRANHKSVPVVPLRAVVALAASPHERVLTVLAVTVASDPRTETCANGI